MKKLAIVILSLILLLTVACGGEEPVDDIDVAEEVEPIEEVEQEVEKPKVEKVEKPKVEEVDYIIGIEVEFHETFQGDTHLSVAGRTNLPDGEKIIISVSSEENGYSGADTQEVKDEMYLSEPFSNKGESLPSGKYKIIVETSEIGKAKQEETIQVE